MARCSMRMFVLLLALSGVYAFRKNSKQQISKQKAADKELALRELKARTEAKQKAADSEVALRALKARLESLAKQGAKLQVDGRKISQVLTTVVGIATSMISAFTEDPPDFEYAFDALNVQGWKIVTTLVPADHQSAPDFQKAKRAWQVAFDDSGLIIEGLVNAAKEGDVKAIIEAVVGLVGTGLKTAAAAVPAEADLLVAISDLVEGTSNNWLNFCVRMGWLKDNGSFNVQSSNSVAIDGNKLTQILTTSVGIVTTFISAFTEDPPDFEYAFDAMQIQGWKLVKLCVPEEHHRADAFKKAQQAWMRVFEDATIIAEEIMRSTQGDISAIVIAVLQTIDTALKTAADVVEDANVANILENVADLIIHTGRDWLQFASRVGWLPTDSFSLSEADKGFSQLELDDGVGANATWFWSRYTTELSDCKGNLRDLQSSTGKLGDDNPISGVADLAGLKIDSPTFWLRVTTSPSADLDHNGGSAFEGTVCDSPDLSVKALGSQVALIKVDNVACPVADSMKINAVLNIHDVAIVRTALMVGHLDFEFRVKDGDREIVCLDGHMKATR